jgi:Zn-dependent protease with chaperone function
VDGAQTRPSYPTIPGPADRVLFDEMQARQRTAARRYAVLGVLAVALAGIPVSLVVTPLVFIFLLIGFRVSAISGTAPPAAATLAHEITSTVRAALQSVLASEWPAVDARTLTLLFLPGAVVMVALWFAVRFVVARAGTGGALAASARDPAAGDFEEYQLANVVGEMAIAGGTAAPRLLIMDSRAANAAAIGARRDAATIVVTRGLLDRLDREETQGVVGHVVASTGNDDLRFAVLLLSVQQTLGLLTTILNLPFGPQSRRMLGKFLWPSTIADRIAAADFLAEAGMNTDDDLSRFLMRLAGPTRVLRVLLRLPVLPLFFVAITSRMSATLVTGGLFGWIFAAVWRRRRLTADAMAVQLTRNPDALARGLNRLIEGDHRVAGAEHAAHLFAAWLPDPSGKHPLPLVFGGVGTLAPSMAKRREALRRMGAGSVAKARRTWGWKDLLSGPSRTLLLLLPAIVIIGGGVALLVLASMIAFNFLILSGLLLAIDWAVDAVAGFVS